MLRHADRRPRPATTTSARMRWCPPSTPAVPLPAGLRAGLGVNVPFGLETSYSRDWVGRYHGGEVRAHDRQHQPRPGLAAGRLAQRRRRLPGAVCRRHADQRRRFRHHRRRQRHPRLGAGRPGRLCAAARRRLGLWLERRCHRRAAGRHPPGRRLPLRDRPHAARRRRLHRRRCRHRQRHPRRLGRVHRHRRRSRPDHAGQPVLRRAPGPDRARRGDGRGAVDRLERVRPADDQVRQPGPARQRHRGGMGGHLVLRSRHHLQGHRCRSRCAPAWPTTRAP